MTSDTLTSDTLSDLAAHIKEVQASGRIVVTTNGCFDLFHAGHLDTLEAARRLGDLLIVLLNSDASVRRLKGPLRPYLDQQQRKALLEALRVVDRVVVFEEDTPERVLSVLRPRLHVKGGSYEPARVESERQLLATWGGSIAFVGLRPGISSTELIRRIKKDEPVALNGFSEPASREA